MNVHDAGTATDHIARARKLAPLLAAAAPRIDAACELPRAIDPCDGRFTAVYDWLASLGDTTKVADVGCGPGRFGRSGGVGPGRGLKGWGPGVAHGAGAGEATAGRVAAAGRRIRADEAAANPGFAKKLEDSLSKFAEGHVEAKRAQHRVGDFHPFIELKKLGADDFRARLAQFDAKELKVVIEKYNLDPAGSLKGKAAKKALAEHVFAAAQKRAERDAKLFEY